MTSSEENFLTSPANLTSLWDDPFGPVRYGTPRPVGANGLGAINTNPGGILGGATQGAASGFMFGGPIGAAIGGAAGAVTGVITGLFTPNIAAQDATTLVNGIEPILKANVGAFLANPSLDAQAHAANVFLSYWQAL